MTKKATQIMLGLAVTAVIGAGAIGANGFLVSSALAADTNQEAPTITADMIPNNENAKYVPLKANAQPGTKTESPSNPAAVIRVDDNGRQTIVFDESLTSEDKARLQKDLEGGIKARENTAPVFVAGTPSKNDLTEAAAIKTAKDAIVKKFALTDKTLSRFSIHAAFNVVDPKAPVWSITFYPTNQNDFSEIGTYNITIDSLSGKIIKILSAADGVG